MTLSQSLAATWRMHARVRVFVPEANEGLETLLSRSFEAARAPWPAVLLPAAQFVRHLAERLPRKAEGSRLESLLGQLRLADLYLACACAAGVPAAIAAFEQHHLAKLPARLAMARVPAATIDDVCQMVREKLLVRTARGEPHIATYSGEGELQNFTYVIGVRFARKLKPAIDDDVDMLAPVLPVPGPSPLEKVIKRRFNVELREVLREALEALSSEQRYALRLHYGHKVSTTQLGKTLGVNQSTASRRLEAARQLIYEETLRILRERLLLSQSDLQSFLGGLNSELDVSLSQIFGEEDEDGGEGDDDGGSGAG